MKHLLYLADGALLLLFFAAIALGLFALVKWMNSHPLVLWTVTALLFSYAIGEAFNKRFIEKPEKRNP